MSSDESCIEDDNEVLVSKTLEWESSSVAVFKKILDDAALTQKSPLARRQMKPRRRVMDSSRPKPITVIILTGLFMCRCFFDLTIDYYTLIYINQVLILTLVLIIDFFCSW